jgi:integrase
MPENSLTRLDIELKKSPGVDLKNGRIRIRFLYRGVRCSEVLKGVKPNIEGVKFAARKREAILYEITLGTFSYRAHFPESRRADIFDARKRIKRTVEEGVDLWLAIQKVRKAKATYRGYRIKGNRVKKAFADRQIASITRSELQLYQANLVDEAGLDPKTVNDIFTVIRGVWSAAAGDSVIDKDITQGITNYDTSGKESEAFPFTQEELRDIAKTPTDRHSEINMLMFNCWVGLSASELIAMAWEDIDFNRWTVRVRRARVDAEWKVPKEKVRERTVEILHPARAWLLKQRPISEHLPPIEITVRQRDNTSAQLRSIRPVWINTRTREYYPSDHAYSSRFLSGHLKKARVPYRALNQTRHTFASQMLSNYISKDWIINQLGHKNYDMLHKHYAKFIPSDTPLLANLIGQQLGLNLEALETELVPLWSQTELKIIK